MGKEKGKAKNKDERVGFGTLMIWQSRSVSTTVVTLLLTYLMIYCTDTLKMDAAVVSMILVASKFLDGVTDMFAGFIVDRTETRWGKARPYEIFIVLIWLCTWLMFSCPESLSGAMKCVWIFVMYALVNSVCYTFLNANGTAYTARAFKEQQIVKLTSYGSVVTMLAGFLFNIFFPSIMGRIATSPSGWSRLVAVMAVPMVAIGVLRMLFVKEKYDVDVTSGTEKVKAKDVVTVVKTNKYILLIAVTNLIFNFVCNMGVNTYYYTYIVGNIGLMGLASAVTILAIPLAFVFPALIKKFSVSRIMMFGFFVSAAGYLVNFFAGANMVLLMIGAVLTGAGSIPASMLVSLLILDCADFNEWKGIHRMEGTMSAINGLGGKIGAAVGAGALGILLKIAGYTGDAATMPASAYTMIRLLMSLIPMALYIVTGLSLCAYKLDKLKPQIQKDNEVRRAAAAEKG